MVFAKYMLAVCLMGLTTLSEISQAQNTHLDFLAVHNKAREEVGVGPLTWNKTVARYARNYAKQRVDDCNMQHSNGPYGENLAGGYNDSAISSVKFWLREKPNYDYKNNKCVNDECLHYTQIVWRNSKCLGCSRVRCKNRWLFVICNYDPPGNVVGERPYQMVSNNQSP